MSRRAVGLLRNIHVHTISNLQVTARKQRFYGVYTALLRRPYSETIIFFNIIYCRRGLQRQALHSVITTLTRLQRSKIPQCAPTANPQLRSLVRCENAKPRHCLCACSKCPASVQRDYSFSSAYSAHLTA